MKRRGYGQRQGPLCAAFFRQFHGALDSGGMAGNHHLPATIVIRRRADIALRCVCCDSGDRVEIESENDRHCALTHRHGGLHRLTARLEEPCCGREVDRARSAQCRIFAERMPRDKRRFLRQPNAAFAFEDAQCRNRIRHDRRLGIFGQRQCIVWPLCHDAIKRLPQRLIDFTKNFACGGAGVG